MEARTYLFPWGTSNFGNAWRLLKMLPRMISILRREHPDVIFSTGAEAAVPFIYIGKILGARIVFVESFTRIFKPSVTGRLVYPICDLFIVQHPELLSYYGKKARYEGSIL
jgi:beta-1,4-N-acetylglucosaminyltransferase